MTDDQQTPDVRELGLEPGDLDGHTLEELSDYLDAGRRPLDPSIEGSPGCQLALDALDRLRGLGGQLIEADAAAMPEVDDSWVDRILTGIALDARAGRRIPFVEEEPAVDFGITEGAVRGLIRSAENAVPGILVGRSTLDGDVTVVGSPVRIAIEVNAVYGESIPKAVEMLRSEVARRLQQHTDLTVTGIDVTVRDVQRIGDTRGERS
ncbi:Asp23/Gls24 family envelope stress response protein [Microbacterium hydrocarbonoxydans]|uniref:Asp23 family, cell envelope-related function n=1 Tax=Microbacterium hydrocarbonoxydans TaxID=273678 RepID=A0A1H4PTR4_9MICO|nr:Asp23/Gls24 family envelope stress response protein [Microbacterium hydrocarbonoxydans]SEC10759.1 Asp23 family, cell envelope-related function [Microbacterium hydrocarbonoxydans]